MGLDRSNHRRKILAGNWKMHFSPGEAQAYFAELHGHHVGMPKEAVDRVFFPVAYCLTPHVQEAAATVGAHLGAQNVHWEDKGAFTGELTAVGLRDIGVRWCLIGHSERRQYFGESDETAGKRLAQALRHGMNVVYCIGERLEQREAGQTEAVLARQLEAFTNAVKTLSAEARETYNQEAPAPALAIAYEPVWAIGTGRTATPEQAQEAHAFIRRTLSAGAVGANMAARLPLLYGGSVTADNAKALLSLHDVDGVLVGGASLKADAFAKILTAI